METKVSTANKEIIIGDGRPTVLIGERINPTGKKKLADALRAGDMEIVKKEALAQVQAGADILDVNVGTSGVDQVSLLPCAVQTVMSTVDVPLCIDSDKPEALKEALKVYRGKPIINSVTGQEKSLKSILPLVSEYKTAVIGLCMDDGGIPDNADRRVAVARKIVGEAEKLGIPREDIIIDCMVLTLGAESNAGTVAIEAIRKVKAELGVNMTFGGSNISFGLPDRDVLNRAFLAISIDAGISCPVVDVAKVRETVLATDLILSRDKWASRYIGAYRERQKQHESKK